MLVKDTESGESGLMFAEPPFVDIRDESDNCVATGTLVWCVPNADDPTHNDLIIADYPNDTFRNVTYVSGMTVEVDNTPRVVEKGFTDLIAAFYVGRMFPGEIDPK
jgi:hypothetical protein